MPIIAMADLAFGVSRMIHAFRQKSSPIPRLARDDRMVSNIGTTALTNFVSPVSIPIAIRVLGGDI